MKGVTMKINTKTIEKLENGSFRSEVLVNGKRQAIIIENLKESSIVIEGDKFNKVYRVKDDAIEAACAKNGRKLPPRDKWRK